MKINKNPTENYNFQWFRGLNSTPRRPQIGPKSASGGSWGPRNGPRPLGTPSKTLPGPRGTPPGPPQDPPGPPKEGPKALPGPPRTPQGLPETPGSLPGGPQEPPGTPPGAPREPSGTPRDSPGAPKTTPRPPGPPETPPKLLIWGARNCKFSMGLGVVLGKNRDRHGSPRDPPNCWFGCPEIASCLGGWE